MAVPPDVVWKGMKIVWDDMIGDIAQRPLTALETRRLFLGDWNVARNRVDEVLGFDAPDWVDELVMRKKIDRRTGRHEEIQRVLEQEATAYQLQLASVLAVAEAQARALGQTVIAADLLAASRLLRKAPPPLKAFYSNRRDPRTDFE